MRLIVGLTKKVGLPGYGSLAACCQVESSEFSAELSSDGFSRRVEQAFEACRRAVERELQRQQSGVEPSRQIKSNNQPVNGNGDRPATPKQLNALRGLAAKCRLPREELQRIFGGKPIAALTIAEASAAIDRLKGGAMTGANGYPKGVA
jgi:hypothetical protein